ncbi:MAG: type IV pilus assembly protein PilM [Nitrospinota bacterium]|nr:pilus assembly protein PilM [Nitrospinota bacterium]
MLFPKKTIGLDIGSHSIKFVVLKKSGKSMSLVDLGHVPLKNRSIVDSSIEDPEAVIEAIENLFSVAKLKKGEVVASLSGPSLVIKKISLPKMPPEELEEVIQSEAEQHIPFDINDVNIDFQPIGDRVVQGDGDDEEEIITTDVLLVAVRQELVEERRQVILDAGFIPIIFDLDVFALENLLEHNLGGFGEQVVAIVNMGASFTNVNIIADGVTEVTRAIPGAGNKINYDIQKEFNVAWEKAEELKKGISLGNISEKKVVEVIINSLEGVCYDINRMFRDFIDNSGRNIDKVYFSGGCANIVGIEDLIRNNLGISTEIIDPFAKINVDNKKFDPDYIRQVAPIFAVAAGLALRDYDDKGLS